MIITLSALIGLFCGVSLLLNNAGAQLEAFEASKKLGLEPKLNWYWPIIVFRPIWWTTLGALIGTIITMIGG